MNGRSWPNATPFAASASSGRAIRRPRIKRRRSVTICAPRSCHLQDDAAIQVGPGAVGSRSAEEHLRRARFRHPPPMNEDEVLSEPPGLTQIVSDQDDLRPVVTGQLQAGLDRQRRRWIEIGRRFVQNRISGPRLSARASANRCCSPAERTRAGRSARCPRPERRNASNAFSPARRRDSPRIRRTYRIFARAERRRSTAR